MRIPLLYIPKTGIKKFLYIDKQYNASRLILPIGCDCHPAYCLQKLHIRQHSFPFDWLNITPVKTISYVLENINTNFIFFLENLAPNDAGNIVSATYPFAEFIHEKDLDTNPKTQQKFVRRQKRFLEVLANEPVDLLLNIPASEIQSQQDVDYFHQSVTDLAAAIKSNDRICIYIRYDENLNENAVLTNTFTTQLLKLPKVTITQYCRSFSHYGIWGNPNKYPQILASLGIKLQKKFPKIYIK
ncbi:hypothetical protein FMM05_07180 [Flavobacterium zepuense]|uniref:Papain-like cysteine peptidase n=1 Tax=Flavobacterium zepuense TaxID=2593302 RepID=A0A552V3N0_9FLAO|nr:DUF1796 family putative cysteine peptidase [Flavobacterium zepuense]TRW25090.1 hypothetical protein FMM05_07180 [Flavobacterium zepuense]